MKKILSLLVSLLVLATPVFAAEEAEFVDPGVTPNSPVYGLDRALERIQLAITFKEEEKAKLKFKFAEERLAEAEVMAEEGEEELAEELMEDYEEGLNETNEEIERAVARGQNVTDLVEHVSTRTSKHLEVLQRVYEKVPEQARAAIAHAMEVSVRKQVGVLAHIEDGEEIKERVRNEINEILSNGKGTPESVKEKVRNRVEEELEDEEESKTEIEDKNDDESENEQGQRGQE